MESKPHSHTVVIAMKHPPGVLIAVNRKVPIKSSQSSLHNTKDNNLLRDS